MTLVTLADLAGFLKQYEKNREIEEEKYSVSVIFNRDNSKEKFSSLFFRPAIYRFLQTADFEIKITFREETDYFRTEIRAKIEKLNDPQVLEKLLNALKDGIIRSYTMFGGIPGKITKEIKGDTGTLTLDIHKDPDAIKKILEVVETYFPPIKSPRVSEKALIDSPEKLYNFKIPVSLFLSDVNITQFANKLKERVDRILSRVGMEAKVEQINKDEVKIEFPYLIGSKNPYAALMRPNEGQEKYLKLGFYLFYITITIKKHGETITIEAEINTNLKAFSNISHLKDRDLNILLYRLNLVNFIREITYNLGELEEFTITTSKDLQDNIIVTIKIKRRFSKWALERN